jgi:hypothetical protein
MLTLTDGTFSLLGCYVVPWGALRTRVCSSRSLAGAWVLLQVFHSVCQCARC